MTENYYRGSLIYSMEVCKTYASIPASSEEEAFQIAKSKFDKKRSGTDVFIRYQCSDYSNYGLFNITIWFKSQFDYFAIVKAFDPEHAKRNIIREFELFNKEAMKQGSTPRTIVRLLGIEQLN